MSSPPALPSSSISSSTVPSSVVPASAKQLAWQTAVYLLIALVVVAIICGTIMLIWNDDWSVIRRHLKLESFPFGPSNAQCDSIDIIDARPNDAPLLPHGTPPYFSAPSTSCRSAATSALPLFTAPGLLEPQRAALRPAMPRDSSVSLDRCPGSEPANLPP